MPFKAHFDYDSEAFYEAIFTNAIKGLNDYEIAYELGEQFNTTLDPETFSCMKNGNYVGWDKEENSRRSERILKELARGRHRINAIVRGAYLKAALGGKKTKNKNVIYRHIYNEQGEEIDKQPVQTTVSEIELAPNIQALSVWLYQHDPEWRKVQRGRDTEASDIPADIEHGVDIDAWIKKETEVEK